MELERLAQALGPVEVVNPAAADVRELAYDARLVEPGTLFFCVRGAQADGHEFAAEAVANGAEALVVERPLDLPVPQLVVADARAAMPRAAVVFYGDPTAELDVAGVTGTNGKTTTAFLLFAVLAAAGRRPGLLGTIECRVGGERRAVQRTTPEAIDLQRTFREMLDSGDRSCAIEASSHASALGRLDGTRFAALVFTNLSQDHLDFHGTMEEYYASKRRLFEAWPGGGERQRAVGPAPGRRGARRRRRARDLRLRRRCGHPARGARVDAPRAHGSARDGLDVTTALRGRFNVENVLGTIAAARLLGLEDDAVARGIASLRGVPGRFEAVDEGQPFAVIVDYAHTPEALENVLRSARDLASGRVVCVFGCGGDRDRGKRPLMGRAAVTLADRVIVTSDNPRSEDPLAIIEEILGGALGADVEPDRAAAIGLAIELADEGDVVLIAGKGHEQGQELADRKIPFDDREVAREALRRLGAAA